MAEGEAAPAEGEGAPASEGEVAPAPETVEAAPAVEKTPEQLAEEAAAAEAANVPEIPADVLEAAAKKFANGTMAAARRAEARVAEVKAENVTVKAENAQYREFVQAMRAGDPTALRRVGFASIAAYLEALQSHGGEKPPASADDRVAALEKRLADEEAARKASATTAAVEASKAAVFKAVDASPKHPHLATRTAKALLWDAIVSYHETHGDCPDAAVWALADEVEKDQEADLGPVIKKFSGNAKPASNGAAPGTLNPGKTVAGVGSSGAPSTREYSMDPDIRRKQVTEDMRASGELQ